MRIKTNLFVAAFALIAILNYFLFRQADSLWDEAFLLGFIAVVVLSYYIFIKYVVKPLEQLKGKASDKLYIEQEQASEKLYSNNEIQVVDIIIQQLSDQINTATEFIQQIEQGNLDATYNDILDNTSANKGMLANALISMRNKMVSISKLEKERNWAIEGLAQFADILRGDTQNVDALSNAIIMKVVKYVNANQGGLFLYHEEPNPHLNLTASYAYERRKHLERKINIGEGLIGQTYLEKESTYLTEVPEEYLIITSGLGKSNPRSILIVPLLFNEDVLGVIELASFNKFEPYQIAFLEKLGENIAATLATVKIAQQTKKLLDESQEYALVLKSQEEEMRQNMEELIATQESQQRLQQELRLNEEQLQAKLAELEEAKKILESKEAELQATNERSTKKAKQFKQKMEELDLLLEQRDREISSLKKEKADLLSKLEEPDAN